MTSPRFILVLEDDAAVAAVLEGFLRRFGFETVIASDGAVGVAIYGKEPNRFSLVIADYSLPLLDGLTALRSIQAIQPVPAILMSGSHPDDLRRVQTNAERYGLGILPKPFGGQQLRRTVEAAIEGAGGYRRAAGG